MHEQLKQTLNFKNCLGVFQGGGCKALAFVGAYKEAKKRGVNFSEVAGTSAGSIIAALVAAGASPTDLENLLADIDFSSFKAPVDTSISKDFGFKQLRTRRKIVSRLTPSDSKAGIVLKILDNLGLFSSIELESWLNETLKKLLNIQDRDVYFSDLKLPLHVIATDISKQQQIIWNEHHDDGKTVARAVRSSCTIPLFFQPVEMKYVDGGLVSNLPSFTLNEGERHFEKILCFTLSGKPEPVECFESYFKGMANSIIDGAVNIQNSLQDNTFNIVIRDLPVSTTSFDDINYDIINEVINIGEKAAAKFFDNEMIEVSESRDRSIIKLSKDYILNAVVMEDIGAYSKVYLSFSDTKIIYSLFPTILSWLSSNVDITFITRKINKITDKESEIKHENYRRFLIKRFGIRLIERENVPFNAFIFTGDSSKTICLHSKEEREFNIGHGAIYDGATDLHVTRAFISLLNLGEDEEESHKKIRSELKNFTVEKIDSMKHIERLKTVSCYSNAKVSFEEVEFNIQEVRLMTKYVKSYKYNQIEKLDEFLSSFGLNIFEPSVIKFSDDIELLITPIVIEKHGHSNIVIKGNSRLTYIHRLNNSKGKYKALVANGVSKNLPSTGDNFPVTDIIITTKNKEGETRYENWDYKNFRNIEESVRNPNLFQEV